MKIRNAEIMFFKKEGFTSSVCEGVKHIKVLPYLSIVQSKEGSYDISIGDGATYQTGDGGFFVAPAGVRQTIVHHTNKKSEKMICRWLFIDVKLNNSYKPEDLYQFPIILDQYATAKMNLLFDQLFSSEDFWENQSCCFKILGLLFSLSLPSDENRSKAVRSTIEYISKNYSSSITVAQLANLSNMSESNFYAVFKRHMGCSPIAYLNYYRLSIAANLIIETNTSISEIGYSVGISDPLYFSKLFKKVYKISPREYRKVYQNA